MKHFFMFLSCLFLAVSSPVAGGTLDLTNQDPATYVDGIEDEMLGDLKSQEDELLDDNQKFSLINGQDFGPKRVEFDYVEDPGTDGPIVVDGKPVGDEMDAMAEDPAYYGWTKYEFSWCTVNGRELISKDRNNPIDYLECQRRCEKRPGCTAIEFWTTYNYACFVCTDTSKITPYTNQADLAYPVHVWVQNEQGSGESGSEELATPSLPPPHEEVNVTCLQNDMYISIPRSLLHGLDAEHLRLSDVSCGATETPTHFTLHTSLTGCHTRSRHTKDFVCYSNKVEEIPLEEGQIITRVREVEIPFACYYSNMGVVSAVGLEVKSKKIVFSKKGFGEFVLEMEIFPDDKFHGQYQKKDFPVEVKLRQKLYVEVSVVTEDSRLEILAEDCFATPDPDPNNAVLKYTFIEDGCAIDDTVEFFDTDDERIQRFKLEAFSFVGDHPFVYMHCNVKICNATDPNSRCAQGCLHDRRKRSLYSQESNDEEYDLAQGPFILADQKDDETKAQETLTGLRDAEKSGQFTSLVAAMAVVAAVCLVGVSYFAWDKKKRSAARGYQLLHVATED